jgi:transcription initiation factor IIE alpha subunit
MAFHTDYSILVQQKRSFNYTKLYKIRHHNNFMAQGVYHVFNFAKMRLLKAVYQSYPNAVTSKEIAAITGMEHGKVSRLLTHYHNHNYRYFRRLKKKDSNGGYRYKINKKGVKAMMSFILRVHQGYDLNLRKKTPVIVAPRVTRRKPQIRTEKDLKLSADESAPYIKVSYRGEYELDVKTEDKLRIVGIVKEKPVKEPEAPEPEVPITSEEPVLPSKVYDLKGETMTSEEMAETLQYAITKINNQLQSTSDAKIIKKLNDKKRTFLMWIHYNPDIKQYVK